MAWIALTCPQCSAPLPRVAIWRSVKCPACGSLVTRTETTVERDSFRQALVRSRQGITGADSGLICAGQSYRLIRVLGRGEGSEIHLARRIGVYSYLATLKLAHTPAAAARHAAEAAALREILASLEGAASTYAYQCLPELIAEGPVAGSGHSHALVLRHPHGYWGSLAALSRRFPGGIDPRHAVWIWRRILNILHFTHTLGWSHGDMRPEHALVQPQDHGIRLIGWTSARKGAGNREKTEDLQRSAKVILALLGGAGASITVPRELSSLLEQVSEDAAFCATHGPLGTDTLLREAARTAFGPPAFAPLIL